MNYGAGVFIGAILLLAAGTGIADAGDGRRVQPVVIELYTSQGCSDCPPADAILTDLARRNDVVALSFPITYWDMLGWRDTLATSSNTRRQNSYAESLGRTTTYTPQVIVDGVEDVIGNKRGDVISAITRHGELNRSAEPIAFAADYADEHLTIDIAGNALSGDNASATIWVMRLLSHAEVVVAGGENRDRALTYTNVVRDIRRAGSWSGGEKSIRMPLALDGGEYDGVAVIVQANEHGEVLAAALLRRESHSPN
jgi:hypothetical protein